MRGYAVVIGICAITLILIGSLLVMSASSTFSDNKFDDPFYLFNSHFFKAMLGVVLMIIITFIDYKWLKPFAEIGLIVSILFLIAVFFTAQQMKGAQRTLDFGLFAFQPTELAKLSLFIFLAKYLEMNHEVITDFKQGIMVPLLITGLVAGLIFTQPNVSNGTLIIAVVITTLFVAGINLKHFVLMFSSAVVAILSVALLHPHSNKRISNYLSQLIGDSLPHPQVLQSYYGMGTGGLLGVGLGNSNQRNLFLPEAYGDFIFAVAGEEGGMFLSVVILVCYSAILFCGFAIAAKANDKFGQILAFSISFSLCLYGFVNAAVATGLVPVTGLPLPLISHGGTAIVIVCLSIGILMSIGINTKIEKIEDEETKQAVA